MKTVVVVALLVASCLYAQADDVLARRKQTMPAFGEWLARNNFPGGKSLIMPIARLAISPCLFFSL